MKFYLKLKQVNSRKLIRTCCQQTVGHFFRPQCVNISDGNTGEFWNNAQEVNSMSTDDLAPRVTRPLVTRPSVAVDDKQVFNFLKKYFNNPHHVTVYIHKRHLIPRPYGRAMRCLL